MHKVIIHALPKRRVKVAAPYYNSRVITATLILNWIQEAAISLEYMRFT